MTATGSHGFIWIHRSDHTTDIAIRAVDVKSFRMLGRDPEFTAYWTNQGEQIINVSCTQFAEAMKQATSGEYIDISTNLLKVKASLIELHRELKSLDMFSSSEDPITPQQIVEAITKSTERLVFPG